VTLADRRRALIGKVKMEIEISWLGYGVDTRMFVHGINDRTVTGDGRCVFEL